jgi:hypothetical protein
MIAARNVPSISGLDNKPEMTQSNPESTSPPTRRMVDLVVFSYSPRTICPPLLCPPTVILSGSPPKLLANPLKNLRPVLMSFKPRFGSVEEISSGGSIPRTPKLFHSKAFQYQSKDSKAVDSRGSLPVLDHHHDCALAMSC